MLYRAVIFTFIPTALELLVVCAVLARNFSPLVVRPGFSLYSLIRFNPGARFWCLALPAFTSLE